MTDAFEEPLVLVERDRYGRYKLPDPRAPEAGVIPWTRATTLARTLSDEFSLNQWRVRQTVYGIGKREDLWALAASTHVDDRDTLQDIGDQAQAAAESGKGANLGRAFHSFSQRTDASQDGVPTSYLPYLRAYQDALSATGFEVRPQYVERVVVCPEIKTAGQFDRLLLPQGGGRLVVGDLKTAKLDSIKYAWLEISIQLAVYAHATVMWDHGAKRYHAMPDVDLTRAIVMHMPHDLPSDQARCDIYEVDILKGWEHALLAGRVREARTGTKKLATKLDVTLAPPEVAVKVEEIPAPDAGASPLGRVRAATGRDGLSALWREGVAAGWWTPELTAAGAARLRELT